MILYIDCPHCGQKHGIYLSTQLLQGKRLVSQCPITHEKYAIQIRIKVEAIGSFDKSDLSVAEEQAKFEDFQWRTEEDAIFREDKDQ